MSRCGGRRKGYEGAMKAPVLSADELTELLKAEFPEAYGAAAPVIEAVWRCGCRIRRPFHKATLRPGGTISGPTMMGLADFTLYVSILASVGWAPLAVTTNLNMNFLRKPEPRDLVAEGKLIKLGKRLAVGEVAIRSDGSEEIVAHATGTYSIPAAPG